MKTLIIKDLARTEELDRAAMATVHGGWKMPAPSYSFDSFTDNSKSDSSVHVGQDLAQYQNVMNSTANGSAFLNDVYANNNTKQFGQNNVAVYH